MMALSLPPDLANALADWLEREIAKAVWEEAEAIRQIMELEGKNIRFEWVEDGLSDGSDS